MPRDVNGNYEPPPSNPVQSGDLIESDWANDTIGDLSIAMTDSLSRSGDGGMLAPLRTPDGTVTAPTHSFNDEPLSGLYRAGANDVRMTIGNADRMRWRGVPNAPEIWDDGASEWVILGAGGISWEYAPVIPVTIAKNKGYVTAGNQTALMPATPADGDSIAFADLNNNFDSEPLTLDGNGNTFTQDSQAEYLIDLKGAFAQFAYLNGQWEIVNFARLSDAYGLDLKDYSPLATTPNPNLITNGAFEYWQRGTSFTGYQGYTADRWAVNNNQFQVDRILNTDGTLPWTYHAQIGRDTYTSSRHLVTTIPLDTAGEAGPFIVGETYTLSAMLRTSEANTSMYAIAKFADNYESNTNAVDIDGGSSPITPIPADTWTPFTYTFTFDAAPNPTNVALRFFIGFQGFTVNTSLIDIANVKFERGPNATPFIRSGITVDGEYDNVGQPADNALGYIPWVEAKPNPNLIINGAMDYWQRGVGPFNGLGYTADRWKIATQREVNRSTDVPNGDYNYSAACVRTDGTSAIYTSVELAVAGEMNPIKTNTQYTVSFWAKFTLTDEMNVRLAWVDEVTSSTNRAVLETKDVDVIGGAWNFYTLTYDTATGVPINPTNVALEILIQNAGNEVNNEIFVTGVKLEEGPNATPFTRAGDTLEGELAACQRYFERSYSQQNSIGQATSGGNFQSVAPFTGGTTNQRTGAGGWCPFKVEKRVTPTMTIYNPQTGAVGTCDVDLGAQALPADTFNDSSTAVTFRLQSGQSATAGSRYRYHWTAEAEL